MSFSELLKCKFQKKNNHGNHNPIPKFPVIIKFLIR